MPQVKKQRISPINSVIGQNIKALRIGAGLSLEDLADHLQVSYQQVQKYETGGNRFPLQYVPVLCDVFGIPAEMFLNGLLKAGSRMDNDIAQVQLCVARVRDRNLRRKIVDVVDILAA